MVSNEVSTIGQALESNLKSKEVISTTFWNTFEDHEASHRSEIFQQFFMIVFEICQNGNEK